MKKTKHIEARYEAICKEYIDIFCEKQDMEFQFWVADIVGGVAYCSDFYFDFADIRFDINANLPKGAIITWYYDRVEGKTDYNYPAYMNQLPF